MNVGINALTALTEPEKRSVAGLSRNVEGDGGSCLRGSGSGQAKRVRIGDDPIEKVKAVAEATKGNRSSMGQDIDFRRKTEIDAINGAVVREAKRLGIPVPYNEVVTDLIRAIEKRF